MKTKRFTLIVSFVLLASTVGCGDLLIQPTYTPRPTYTNNPTYTLIPPYTSTITPFPTLAIPASTSIPKPPPGNPVIDVTYQLKDFPLGGITNIAGGKDNYWWALETVVLRLQFWPNGGTYVVYTHTKGTFVTWAGKSLAGTGTVGAGVTGTSSEESGLLLTGALLASPPFPLSGFIGSFDVKGDQQGHTSGNWPWFGSYFQSGYKVEKSLGFSETFATCGNGTSTWIMNTHIGDITGPVANCSLMTQTSTWAPISTTQIPTKTSAKGGGRGPFASMTETPTETLTETPTETLTETPTETPTRTPTVPLQNPNCGSYSFNISSDGTLYARNHGWGDLKVYINGVLVFGPLGYNGYWDSGNIKKFNVPDSGYFNWEVDYADQYMLNLKYNYCVITGSYSTPTPTLVEALTESLTPMTETPTGTLIGTPIPTPTEPNFSLTDPNSWLKGIEWLWGKFERFLEHDIWIPLQKLLNGGKGTPAPLKTGLGGCTLTDLQSSAVGLYIQEVNTILNYSGYTNVDIYTGWINDLESKYSALPDCVKNYIAPFENPFDACLKDTYNSEEIMTYGGTESDLNNYNNLIISDGRKFKNQENLLQNLQAANGQ